MKNNKKLVFMTKAGLIAAVYVVLTMLSAAMGLASNVIQVRISEALCFLPFLTPAAIPGLTVGCLLANLLTGSIPLDIVLGSTATLIGAVCAYVIGRVFKGSCTALYLSTLPTVLSNMLIIPWVLRYGYGAEDAIPFMMLTVGIGEFIACTGIGAVLITAFRKKLNLLT